MGSLPSFRVFMVFICICCRVTSLWRLAFTAYAQGLSSYIATKIKIGCEIWINK